MSLLRFCSGNTHLSFNISSSLPCDETIFSSGSFLKAHPEYQKKFRTFADVPQDQLLHNGNFLAQAFTILGGLNVVIQSMGNIDLLAQEVQQLGGAHKERGVTPAMFEVNFLTVIRWFLNCT